MNYKMVIYTLGLVLLFESAFFLVPIITALIYSEWLQLFAFLITLAICGAIGAVATCKKPKKMKRPSTTTCSYSRTLSISQISK